MKLSSIENEVLEKHKMVKILLLILFTILIISTFLISCGYQNQNTVNTKSPILNYYDTSIIAVLPFNKTYSWILKDCIADILSPDDYNTIDNLLTKCVANYNTEQEIKFNDNKPVKNYLLDLESIKRQYISVVNQKGEREVWVNCFCNTFDKNWKKEIILVEDGGVCFFNVKINLTNKTYYELIVNGIG